MTRILSETLRLLESTEPGRQAIEAIRGKGTSVRFGPTLKGAIAQYDPGANEITVHESLKTVSPRVLAAHLAHEGTMFFGTDQTRLIRNTTPSKRKQRFGIRSKEKKPTSNATG